MISKATAEISKREANEELESPEVGGSTGGSAEEDIASTRQKCDEDHRRIELDRNHKERAEEEKIPKLEIMTDPVQSMLLDMIPTLGVKKVEPTNRATQEEKVDPGPSEELVVPKKKKVSYKDIASELLKDM